MEIAWFLLEEAPAAPHERYVATSPCMPLWFAMVKQNESVALGHRPSGVVRLFVEFVLATKGSEGLDA
jgi:hypothetical protein